ncbi:MAG: GNAT family N-acetyltransferase [Planctomycetaceae bacterium]|nr:GNAT family N-acetyltransferase [Planctomycetaceae bacterium]
MIYTIFPVDWDSKFFGFPVGRINLNADFSLENLNETLRLGKNDFRLIYLFLKEKGPNEFEGFEVPCVCYDRKLVYEKKVHTLPSELDPRLRLYTEAACTKRMESLAVISGLQSRFRRDPQTSPFYEQLFLTWISNAILGGTADAIWVWQGDDGKPSGLATVRVVKQTNSPTGQTVKEGRIGMLAVEEKYCGRGVGSSLIKACEYWSISAGLDQVSLAVPAECPAYNRVCNKAGYIPGSEISVYHYWSPSWEYDPRQGWKYCP